MATFAFEEDKITKVKFGAWGRLLSYSFKRWYLLLILTVCMLFTSFHDSSWMPLLNKAAIETIESFHGFPSTQNLSEIIINVKLIFGIQLAVNYYGYVLLMLGGILLRSVSIFITFFATNYLEMSVYINMRQDAFKRVQQLSFSYFDKTSSGWLIARLQSDTSKISDMISWGIIRILWILFDLTFTLITMFTVSWQMALILLAVTPLIMVVAPLFQIKILTLGRIARNAYSGYVAWLAETIAGAKTIKTLAIEDNVHQEADQIITDIKKKALRRETIGAIFYPSMIFITAIGTAIVIYFGSRLMLDPSTTITVTTFIIYIGFVGAVFNPIQEFADIFSDIVATQSSVEKIMSLIDTQPEIIDRPEVITKYGDIFNPKPANYEKVSGHIRFQNVNFSYIPGTEVIHNLNLEIAKGQSVAIVGETGSGKSTTVNLLCRFYEPSEGYIFIDDIDYKDRSVGWLRSNIGYVQQTPFIFSGTVRHNIAYGKLDATDEEIINAAKIADVHEFIMKLPQGYATVLLDGGSELSVGQKQLISFARAIVRNPAIMILDEATSSIDTETEAVIQKSFQKILKGRTSIVIAHRLSTIVNSDRILVMSDGVIVEDGNHRQLLALKGTYYRLYMNQFAELNIEKQIQTFETQIENN